jgi:hypothetical protein
MIASSLREFVGFIRPRLAIRVVDSDPSNYSPWASSAVLPFELWIPIPRIIPHRLAAPSCHSSCGFRSLELFSIGQQRHPVIRVVGFNPSNLFFSADSADNLSEWWIPVSWITSFEIMPYPCAMRHVAHLVHYSRTLFTTQQIYIFRPSAPLRRPAMGFSPQIFFDSGPAAPQFRFGWKSHLPESCLTLVLTLVTRILVAIYQFGCRMSNTKVSPQLATLDGPVIASNALS